MLPRPELDREIAAAAAARADAASFPAERLARIRAAAGRMAARQFRPDDLAYAALLLERQASVDVEVPTASRLPGLSLLKRLIKKLMVWYLRFLAAQVTAFGQATARFGVAVARRVDGLEADVDQLRERVARLEASLSERR